MENNVVLHAEKIPSWAFIIHHGHGSQSCILVGRKLKDGYTRMFATLWAKRTNTPLIQFFKQTRLTICYYSPSLRLRNAFIGPFFNKTYHPTIDFSIQFPFSL